MFRFKTMTVFFSVIFMFLLTRDAVADSSDGKCSSASSFFCPNCGGIQVSDCLDCDGYLSTDINHKICFNRKLFNAHNEDDRDHENHYHYLWNDLVGTLVWFVTAGIAMACGVGGGGIYVPLGILLLQFAPKPSSGLSQASIFGASLGGILLNSRATHPNTKIRHDPAPPPREGEEEEEQLAHQLELSQKQEQEYIQQRGGKFYTRPVIHYDMALFLSPMEMAGAVLGVLVQKILPNWLYLMLAGVVLGITSQKTYQKFWSASLKESQAAAAAMADGKHEEATSPNEKMCEPTSKDSPPPESAITTKLGETNNSGAPQESAPVVIASDYGTPKFLTAYDSDDQAAVEEGEVEVEMTNIPFEDDDEQAFELRKKYLEEDMEQFPIDRIVSLLILWIGLFLLTLMMGGKGVDSIVGITCDDPVYLALVAIQFLWLFGFALYFGYKAKHKQELRRAVNYPFLPHDPIWTARSLRLYGGFTFLAGVVAGLIGIGGGMVLGPLMLILDVHPRVSTATTATMIVLTSSSVAVMFVTSGLVPWTYALYFFVICFVGALVGKSRIDGYVKRTGRASFLIFILASIIAFATVGCFVILLLRLADAEWCFEGFTEFCNANSHDDDDEEACAAKRALSVLAATTTTNTYVGY